jgi:hypothetical protein
MFKKVFKTIKIAYWMTAKKEVSCASCKNVNWISENNFLFHLNTVPNS